MTRHVYRPGDQVQIVNPRWIKRVGYALHWRDVIDKVDEVPGYAAAVKALGLDPVDSVPFYLRMAIAKAHVELNGFGGNERTVHYYTLGGVDVPVHGFVGRVALVDGKRVAYTGTRYPASSGKDADTPNGPGEYWEESGGLDNRKSHLILRTSYGEIEACDVKLVKKVPA